MTAFRTLLFTLLCLLLVGCTSTPPGPTYGGDKTTDVAKPKGSRIDYAKSIILGPGSAWVGRLVYSTGHDSAYMCDFLQSEMTRLGWTYISGIRSKVSVLIFKQAGRVANIQVTDALIYGSIVICDMSPESSGMSLGSDLTLPQETTAPTQPTGEYGAFTP